MISYMNAEGNYPFHKGDIQLLISGWTEGDSLPEGWHEVAEVDPGEAPVHEEVGRQNFWYQTEPEYDAATETWEQTWDYYDGPSMQSPDDGQWWEMDFENAVWVLCEMQPPDEEEGE
tara:strand:- start:49 stop:399 length:351 start_codon:yes stop_codon:yes gene_type:complete